MNAAEIILGGGAPGAPALVGENETLTFGELRAMSGRWGNGLAAAGVGVGDRVLLALDDRPALFGAYLGALRIGAVAAAVNPRWSDAELANAAEDAGAALVVVEPKRGGDALAATDGLFDDQHAALASREMDADAPALWIYTSGTTGRPKAAIHRHRVALAAGRAMAGVGGIGAGDRVLVTSKTFFAYALAHGLLGALVLGATLILHRPWPRPDTVAALAAHTRPTVVYSVPTLYRGLLDRGADTGSAFASVRRFFSAGEALPPGLLARWREATGVTIAEGMGTSETLFLVIANPPEAVRPGSAGLAVPGSRLELRDDAGAAIDEPGRIGALWVATDSLATGYWRRSDATAAAFVDGWYRTGDRFHFDADGYWYHDGRMDDMLKIAGQWVNPAEIESCVTGAGLCGEAALVSAADGDGLGRTVLFLAEVGRAEGIAENVRQAISERLSRHKCPSEIRLVDALPRTATGKVQRYRLREMAETR